MLSLQLHIASAWTLSTCPEKRLFRQVGLLFGYRISTVAAVIKKINQSGTAEDVYKSDRPRITTSGDDSIIQRKTRLNPSLSGVDIRKSITAHHGLDVNWRTVKHYLRSF